MKTISPRDAQRLIASGQARLVDIRGVDEHARARIAGADHVPLDAITKVDRGDAQTVIFHCKSGMRTAANADRLSDAANCEAFVLEGGIDGWRAAGLPVAADTSQPIEIMRQVQITAGTLVLVGVLLGWLVTPAFFALSAFVGAGLTFAGISGWCGLAKLLGAMPWNRRAAA